MANLTYQQLYERTAQAGLAHFRAQNTKKALQSELRSMYDTFFKANGRPSGRFDQYNDDFLPVMSFTEAQFERVRAAKKIEYNALRRYRTAVGALDRFVDAFSEERQ
ncbi:hypothetical protein SAMN05216205_4904 [Pseudomonas mohnii]|uniref:Uncharacterized protein n=1 Tax=Pseudomonas mohnii TaxID=395600 RepID=A0ABY0YC96_9PSED|nr:hypothetical protein [Pseudomonas mohnii]SED32147.1 hypothetical protein SAMN05216205_4904 [Pseudomonas mohnii]